MRWFHITVIAVLAIAILIFALQNLQSVTVAFLGGLVVGALVWSAQMQRSRRELFSQNRFRRLAALGYLSGAHSVETATLLAEYVRWEKDAGLRRRGERALRLMKDYLE